MGGVKGSCIGVKEGPGGQGRAEGSLVTTLQICGPSTHTHTHTHAHTHLHMPFASVLRVIVIVVFLYGNVSEVYVRVVHVLAVVSVLRIAESGESMGISCLSKEGRENKVVR
jgi:hypothetical protein